tara:strand:+ start:2025 stop:2927 length:903 start_codon:yes stop_codon:yes gene_type:complete
MEVSNAIFSQPWGGLGDNLQFSNLPKLFNSIDKKFYISFLNYSRNKEIYDLAWGNNSNVENRRKLFPNVGYKLLLDCKFKVFDKKFNNIQNINKLHGFDASEGFPEISIKDQNHKFIEEKNDIVIDFNAYSLFENTHRRYKKDSFNNMVKNFSSKNTIELVYPHLYKNNLFKSNNKVKEINNLESLISTLINTKLFVCLNSGSHILASGLKNLTGYPKKVVSFNSCHDDIKVKDGKIENKKGKFYFDNVYYEFLDIEYSDNITKSEEQDLQSVSEKMNKYIKLNQVYFNLNKKYTNLVTK